MVVGGSELVVVGILVRGSGAVVDGRLVVSGTDEAFLVVVGSLGSDEVVWDSVVAGTSVVSSDNVEVSEL